MKDEVLTQDSMQLVLRLGSLDEENLICKTARIAIIYEDYFGFYDALSYLNLSDETLNGLPTRYQKDLINAMFIFICNRLGRYSECSLKECEILKYDDTHITNIDSEEEFVLKKNIIQTTSKFLNHDTCRI